MAEVQARLAHLTPGRARLVVPSLVGRPDEGRRLGDAAAALPGVSKAEARAATGSLVIFHDGPWEPIAEGLGATAGLAIDAEPLDEGRPLNALDAASAFIDALDGRARRAFSGRTDLSELTFLVLVAAGALQLARGQVVGPATTLFSQALNLMVARRGSGRDA